MKFIIYLTLQRFFSMLDQLAAFVHKPTALLTLAGKVFHDDIETAQFARSGEPSWHDLSPRYKKAKRARFGRVYPILTASGAMRREFRYDIDVEQRSTYLHSPRTVGRGRYNLLRLHQLGAGNLPMRNAGRIRGVADRTLMEGLHDRIITPILRRAT